ncbi:hypothetical protein C8A00DRAFT_19641 [Chaetomidium leptoderma]|uniref:Zn(2)-C6 fungal-type domain-containing protein n=1 Tax=Chaetomidium leptoderma TaxID=669021 RepID=A0AAN6VBS6_9PEZI|nr:hypothetical protein C8A00DRAFT_19641 [Chaetomidium leptoderma]
MTAPLPRSRTLDPAPPPMPRRQSCDRCHEQKVRCVTEGLDGALTLGGIAEESESSPGAHVISSVPCVRCRKAGAVCIYSRMIGLGILEHPSEDAHEHVSPQINPLPPSTTTRPHYERGNRRGPGLQTPPLTGQWQTPPYGSGGHQFPAGMCQSIPCSEGTTVPAIPCVPLFPDQGPEMTVSTGNVMDSYPWVFPTLPDYSLEELAQINLRIHLAGHALSAPSRALAPLSSPAVNDILDAAYSLANAVDRYASRRRLTPLSEPPAGSPVIDGAFDSSIRLMIHACHQALLGTFEDLSSSLIIGLEEPQQARPLGTPPGPPFSTCSTQAAATTNLISHALNQLDRVISSLASDPGPPHPVGRKIQVATGIFCQPSADWAGSEEFSGQYEPLNVHHRGHLKLQRGDETDALFNEMEQRQRRVRDQVKAVEGLVGGPGLR